jgi:hypothetical protein
MTPTQVGCRQEPWQYPAEAESDAGTMETQDAERASNAYVVRTSARLPPCACPRYRQERECFSLLWGADLRTTLVQQGLQLGLDPWQGLIGRVIGWGVFRNRQPGMTLRWQHIGFLIVYQEDFKQWDSRNKAQILIGA